MQKPKQKRAGSKAQASALEHEMKGFLGAQSRTTAYRAATYRPTLEKFQSTSFSDYVRSVLMGVPLENVESEEPYFPGESDDESDSGSGNGDGDSDEHPAEDGEDTEGDIDTTSKGSSETSISQDNINVENGEGDALSTISTTNQENPEKKGPKRMTTRRMATRSQTGSISNKSTSVEIKKRSPEKENIYEKKYSTTSPPIKKTRSRKRVRGPPLKPDSLKLSDGIAKIIPPVGWWDKAGIGKDTTARGKPWQKGTKLGDMEIPGPIKQCVSGIGGVYDFTMMELPTVTVADFRERADKYRKKQMGKEVDDDLSDDHMDLLARKFWKRLGPTMESSQYGADMEGTLFDGAEACGWNVDQLESCLALLEADYKNADEISKSFKLPGVTSAYLYFGMWASVFSAHTEDMNLLSINYLHAGAPKYWYAIAQEDSDRFESLMASMFSHQAAACPEFLRHKRSLISPSLLKKAGISFTTQVQRAGDIIITFPGSYHFGFNTGFNCAESTNFAVPEWVPFGEPANICMCHPHSVRIYMERFKKLLEQYENDSFHKDGPPLSYSEWAKDFIRKKKRRTQNGADTKDNQSQSKKSKRFVVEVLQVKCRRQAVGKSAPKRKKKRMKIETEDYRIAIPMKASQLTKQTRVLCLLDTDEGEECYFAGAIVNVVESHAKVHFSGATRSEDVWIALESGSIFLDGGPTEAPKGD